MKRYNVPLALAAVMLCLFIATVFSQWLAASVLLTLYSCAVNAPRGRLCAVTLSVPEILKEILAAFKLATPELFGPAGFAKDFKSNTAVLGDKVTGHISHVPLTADYDANNGGFKNGVQDATTLIEDVPVTLNQLAHVPVKISFLTGLATKGVDLYQGAIGNIAYALGKKVVDGVLAQAGAGYVSNQLLVPPQLATLDTFDGTIRSQCNAQKMAPSTRWAFISSELAGALGTDDRVRSALYYGQLNGDQGYRTWKNLGGFAWIKEYPDVTKAGVNIGGIVGDHRLACVSVRKLEDMESTAKSLKIREVMRFYPLTDEESGLELCGISFQEAGTGDVYLTVAILFGVGVGNQGGAPGSVTDNAGLLLKTA